MPQRAFHVRIGQPDDPLGKLLYAAQRPFRPVHLKTGALHIQLHATAQKPVCIQPAQQQIRVCHGGLLAAAVADGPRVRSC